MLSAPAFPFRAPMENGLVFVSFRVWQTYGAEVGDGGWGCGGGRYGGQ